MRAHIAALGGDGIGPEVVREARKVLTAVAEHWGHIFTWSERPIGGAAIDATGFPLPADTLAACKSADAVLLGAVGHPRWDDPSLPVRPEQGLLRLRQELGLYANLRPVAVLPALVSVSPIRAELLVGVDIVVVRELCGGIYFGEKLRGDGWASDLCRYTEDEVVRIARVAGALARARRKRVTSVDKANILETSRLWRRVASRVMASEFPDVELEHMLVDSCAMHLIHRPSRFDVIVTENMFGDILTDEASMLAGSMGMLPSASLADGKLGLYEPVHGSAPDIAGLGIANPYAAILSGALLLRHSLDLETEATAVENAVALAVAGGALTADLVEGNQHAVRTAEAGDAVVAALLGQPLPLAGTQTTENAT
jgi:3-isopropylmalate dehydrogenase